MKYFYRLKPFRQPIFIGIMVLLGLVITSLSSVSAFSTNTFNNSLTTETFYFSSPGTIMRYLSIPSSTNFLIRGTINVSVGVSPLSLQNMNGSLKIGNDLVYSSSASNGSSLEIWNDIISYYKLDDVSGNAIDSASGHTCINNGMVQGITGVINTGYNNTGAAYLDCGTNPAFNITGNMTITAWVKTTLTPGTQTIFAKSGELSGNTQYELRINDGGAVEFLTRDSALRTASSTVALDGRYHFIVGMINTTRIEVYVDGVKGTGATLGGSRITTDQKAAIGAVKLTAPTNFLNGDIDEIGLWNRSLTDTEILFLNNTPVQYTPTGAAQSNSSVIDVVSIINKYLNSTYVVGSNYIIPFIFNATGGNMSYSDMLFDNIGFIENSNSFNPVAYETSIESFVLNITYDSSAYKSLNAYLIYNGTSYSSVKSGSLNNLSITSTINIPPISSQQNNSFYWAVYLVNLTDGIENYNSTINNQTINQLSFGICGGSLNIPLLNFSLNDEITQSLMPSSNINFQVLFNYWTGSGTTYKNYSFQNINSTNVTYQFCEANNINYSINADLLFSANGYYSNNYYLRSAQISNVTTFIPLYLLPTSSDATKFTLTVQQGNNFLSGVIVQLQKQFIGLGMYKTTSIQLTDASGKFVDYLDLDSNYQAIIIQDGTPLGVVSFTASCAVAPCTQTLKLPSAQGGSVFDEYNVIYAGMLVSNITFDKTTKIVSYSFVDLTGSLNYIRLQVDGFNFQNDSQVLCNVYSYSPSGTITCDLSNYTGDFIAKAYISRSPEKIDPSSIYSGFIAEDVVKDLGLDGVFIILGVLITVVFAAAVFSRGSPTAVLFSFGLALLVLKLIHILPYSYPLVAAVEVVIIYLISKIKV